MGDSNKKRIERLETDGVSMLTDVLAHREKLLALTARVEQLERVALQQSDERIEDDTGVNSVREQLIRARVDTQEAMSLTSWERDRNQKLKQELDAIHRLLDARLKDATAEGQTIKMGCYKELLSTLGWGAKS